MASETHIALHSDEQDAVEFTGSMRIFECILLATTVAFLNAYGYQHKSRCRLSIKLERNFTYAACYLS
jgi:hypothetical protein